MSNTNSIASIVILVIGIILIIGGAYLIYLGIIGIVAALAIAAVVELIIGIALVCVGIYLINRRHSIIA